MDVALLVKALLIGVFSYLGGIHTPWLAGISGGYYISGTSYTLYLYILYILIYAVTLPISRL